MLPDGWEKKQSNQSFLWTVIFWSGEIFRTLYTENSPSLQKKFWVWKFLIFFLLFWKKHKLTKPLDYVFDDPDTGMNIKTALPVVDG